MMILQPEFPHRVRLASSPPEGTSVLPVIKEKAGIEIEHIEETHQYPDRATSAPPPLSSSVRLADVLPRAIGSASGGLVTDLEQVLGPRDLVDWQLNEALSMLFIHQLRPEWGGKVPAIAEEGYAFTLLPLDASKQEIVDILARSPLYGKYLGKVTLEDRLAMAQSVVDTGTVRSGRKLTVPEWRHLIGTYLLNLGCEVQCRLDFKVYLSHLRQAKKTLAQPGEKSVVTRQERAMLWQTCQKALYRRLDLDWPIDELPDLD